VCGPESEESAEALATSGGEHVVRDGGGMEFEEGGNKKREEWER